MERSVRSEEVQKQYLDFMKGRADNSPCRMCEMESVKEFKYWRVLENEFPYDKISDKQHILLPKRHTTEEDLTDEEKAELLKIKKTDFVREYQFIFESTPGTVSIPAHFHLHLVRIKHSI